MIAVLRFVAAVACFLMAMMAARDAQTARHRGKPIAFVAFVLLALLFSAAMAAVLFGRA